MAEPFNDIYEKYKDDIFRLALSYTNNYADAEDITINTFFKLYRNFNKIKNDDHLKKWLIKVSINECKTLSLSCWKKKVLFFKDNEENNIKDIINQSDILDSLAQLPKTDRLIIHLFYYENYKIEEISQILKKSNNAVKTKLHRARASLKNILKENIKDEK